MKILAFAAATLLAASPALAAQQHRAAAGGDPDLDLTVRPRGAVTAQADPDDNVYLPGLTEPAGTASAADMSQYKGQGGPLDDEAYPACSATVTDNCIELNNPAG